MNILTKGYADLHFKQLIVRDSNQAMAREDGTLLLSFDNSDYEKNDQVSLTKVLILYEPNAVIPGNYARRRIKRFDLVICLNHFFKNQKSQKIITLNQPITRPSPAFFSHGPRNLERIVMICDHKFSASRTSYYSIRREIIRRLEMRQIPIDLYGPNWKMPRSIEFRKRFAALRSTFWIFDNFSINEVFSNMFYNYKHYVGESIDKMVTQSRYRFSLVVENDRHVLSEKLFDSIFAGCITFYIGRSAAEPILEDLCIRLPLDLEEAVDRIQYEMNFDHSDMLMRMKEFVLDVESMRIYSFETIARDISRSIKDSCFGNSDIVH